MIVIELKEELEAQGLPIDGTRQVLYQRVQKARRINRSRGRPLWVPPVEEEEEEVSNYLPRPTFLYHSLLVNTEYNIFIIFFHFFFNDSLLALMSYV